MLESIERTGPVVCPCDSCRAGQHGSYCPGCVMMCAGCKMPTGESHTGSTPCSLKVVRSSIPDIAVMQECVQCVRSMVEMRCSVHARNLCLMAALCQSRAQPYKGSACSGGHSLDLQTAAAIGFLRSLLSSFKCSAGFSLLCQSRLCLSTFLIPGSPSGLVGSTVLCPFSIELLHSRLHEHPDRLQI